jgi:uncharacterized membrane protein YcaP (DUF421 family)
LNEPLVVCLRGIISFFTLLIFTRILGKQQISQITFFDYIIGITIGSFAATLTADLSSSAWPHWVGILTWIVLGILLQIVSLRSKKISQYINDEPIVIVHDGKIIGENLKNAKFTFSELLQELRLKDIFDINEVKFAIIEANGQLSTFNKEQFQNLINSLNIKGKDKNLDDALIFNGIIIDDNLSKYNLNRKWLLDELKKNGFDSAIEVFYAFLDRSKTLRIDPYNDQILNSKKIFK